MSSQLATDAFEEQVARIQSDPMFRTPLVWGMVQGRVDDDGEIEEIIGAHRINIVEHIGSYSCLWSQAPFSTSRSMVVTPFSLDAYDAAADMMRDVVAQKKDEPHANYHAFRAVAAGELPFLVDEVLHTFAIFRWDFVSRAFMDRISAYA